MGLFRICTYKINPNKLKELFEKERTFNINQVTTINQTSLYNMCERKMYEQFNKINLTSQLYICKI